jgi:hypothetical protein
MKHRYVILLAFVLTFFLFAMCTTDVAYASTLGRPCHHRPVPTPRPKPPVVLPIPKPPTPAPCIVCNQKPIDITIERWCGGVHTKLSFAV